MDWDLTGFIIGVMAVLAGLFAFIHAAFLLHVIAGWAVLGVVLVVGGLSIARVALTNG